MTISKLALAVVVAAGAVLPLGGCSAPISAAVSLAGMAVNDADVQGKSKELMGASVTQCDQALGEPLDVYQDQRSSRQWRVYSVKYDALGNYRYFVEVADGRVVAFSKAQRSSDVVVDAATYAYYKDKCMDKSPQQCQDSIGKGPPALSVRNVKTGQLMQLYDARLVKGIQSPYYAVLHFGPDGLCSEVGVVKIAASTQKNPTAPPAP